MNAKEWTEENERFHKHDGKYSLMESYANYKTQELQAKILNFRKTLSENITINGSESDILGQHDKYLLNIYDVYFEIVKLTKDKIGNNER